MLSILILRIQNYRRKSHQTLTSNALNREQHQPIVKQSRLFIDNGNYPIRMKTENLAVSIRIEGSGETTLSHELGEKYC